MVDVTPRPKQGRPQPKPRKPLPARSLKRIAEQDQRTAVREQVLARDGGCVGPAAGLPGECASPDPSRPALEVHETHQRSTHPGSHLVAEFCRALCQKHHSMVTSPVGELRAHVEAVRLIVRSSS